MRFAIAVSLAGWFVLSQAREFMRTDRVLDAGEPGQVNRATEWLAKQDRDLPVVVADPQTFAVLSHYGSGEVKSRIVYLADPDLALKHLGHNSVERGMLDLLRPWFGMNVVEFEPYMAAHSRFLVYGDFVRLSFLNWLLPELHARGWRTELLNRAGDTPPPGRVSRPRRHATPPTPPAAGPLTGARAGAMARDRQATHAQQPTPAR